jgi:5'-phosphate synthase pdxT subunit
MHPSRNPLPAFCFAYGMIELMKSQALKLGVLALQGAFREHRQALERLGAQVSEVRLPRDLESLSGIIIPGGESTTMAKLMKLYGLDLALLDFYQRGGAIWGTCAGAIVMSTEIAGFPEQLRLKLMDISIERNAYGRQRDSFEADIEVKGFAESFHAIFIRAPRIAWVGKAEVLATFQADAIMVKQDRLLATVFHPELSGDDRIHQFFLEHIVQPQVLS